MSKVYPSYHDGSVSDAVFSDEECSVPDFYSQQRNSSVFSHNTSVNSVTLEQDLYSPRNCNTSVTSLGNLQSPRYHSRDLHSPAVSNYSTYSQEVKYIFDPNFGMDQRSRSHSNIKMQSTPSQFEPVDPAMNSMEDDYSQIQFSNRKSSVQRKPSNASQYSYKGQGQGQGHFHSKNPPPPPPRTSSSASSSQLSQQGDATLTPRKSSLAHSMSASYSSYYYPYQQTRRKTWSPDGLRQGYNVTSVKRSQRLRSYSNEQLLDTNSDARDRDHIYEELEAGPPKLAPSGMLNRSPGRGIVKPIAFKPVTPANPKFVASPKQYVDHPRKYSGHDDGYGSQDYGVTNQSAMNTSHGSNYSQMDFDRSASFSSDCNRNSDRADSVAASQMSRLSSNHMDGYVQTPSPSDSGVGELEAILKEKDAEINTLRDVMDKNERAIFQVYEEKRNCWLRDIQEMRDEYEKQIKQLQRKAYKSEQVLNLQVFKLQQDKKNMKDEVDKLNAEKDDLIQKCEVFAEETNRLQAQMDDATWQGQGRRSSGNVSNLQSQIEHLHKQLGDKSEEVLRLQSKLEELKSKLDQANVDIENRNKQISERLKQHNTSSDSLGRLNHSSSDCEPDIPLCHCEKEIQTEFAKMPTPERETLKPSMICEKDKELNALGEELNKLRLEMLVSKEEHDKERETWLEEKNKVIMYQKQLQLNYVQMFRKNKVLEAEVEQLTLELESRDMKLMALNGEESVC